MEEVLVIKRCAMCPEKALYKGPAFLKGGMVFCSPVCEALWVAVTPGQWIDPGQLMPGGLYHEHPEIWSDC